MSTIVNVDMFLISSKGMIPKDLMIKCFNDTLLELNGKIVKNNLYINNKNVGTIQIKDRIVVKTDNDYKDKLDEILKLRDLYNLRSDVLFENYQIELSEQIEKLKQEELAKDKLLKMISELEETKETSIKSNTRQKMDNCYAIKEELIEEAYNQGFDVIDNSTDQIQLQFIKRTY